MNKTSDLIFSTISCVLILGSSTWGMELQQTSAIEEMIHQSEDVLQKKALRKFEPSCPSIAKVVGAEGEVKVEIIIDAIGSVISAKVVSGHPLLRDPVLNAVRQWFFKPTTVSGKPVKVLGILTFR